MVFFFSLMSTFRERKCQNTILFKKEKSYLLCKSRVEILAITQGSLLSVIRVKKDSLFI